MSHPRFVVYATRSAVARAGELGFAGCLECAVEEAIMNGGFVRRVPPTDHQYALEGGLVVRTRYGHERTPGGRRRFLIVGVERPHDNERTRRKT